MPNFNDPIWGVIGVIATIVFGIASVVGVVLTFLQLTQTKKLLSYEIQSVTQIFKIAKGFQEQIEIKMGGEIVRDVYLLIVRFVNSGRASIRPDDFIRPLTLSVKNGKILSVEITNTDPPELGDVIETKDFTSVTFKKILLNNKDEFTVKLLIGDFNGVVSDIHIDARIDGVKRPTELKESIFTKALRQSPSALLPFLAIIMPFGSLVLVVLDLIEAIQKTKNGDDE